MVDEAMRRGLLLIALTFGVVALTLLGQVISLTVRPLPGLYHLLAACDAPTTFGAWLAATGARDRRQGGSTFVARPLLVAALSFSLVALVVYGDLLAGRLHLATLAALFGAKPAWFAADLATLVGMGSLLAASAKLAADGGPHAAARPLPDGLVASGLAALAIRAVTAGWGLFAAVPWPLRLAEAALYVLVGAAAAIAARRARRPNTALAWPQ